MTIRQIVEETLNTNQIVAPDSKTIQSNIDYLAKLAQTLNPQDKQRINAITAGMKQQQALNSMNEKEEEQKKNAVQQPTGQVGTTAQNGNTLETAQPSLTKQTAQ